MPLDIMNTLFHGAEVIPGRELDAKRSRKLDRVQQRKYAIPYNTAFSIRAMIVVNTMVVSQVNVFEIW
ncbi:MAG: hypothetical protein K9N51_05840 [Candidatus Pacebacteria bacterium]|nr:hypothetical protein [Candidatus Paceibacterota bacterium]